MSTPQAKLRLYTAEEYLELERASEEKHEYLDGVIYDMAGGPRYGRMVKAVIPGGSSAKVLRADERFKLKLKQPDGSTAEQEVSLFEIPMDFDSLAAAGSGVFACTDRHTVVTASADQGSTWRLPDGVALERCWMMALDPGTNRPSTGCKSVARSVNRATARSPSAAVVLISYRVCPGATGSAMRSAMLTFRSTMRLTNDVLAPFSSSRRTR